MKKHTVNDLFCGAGGMGLGFKQAGFEIAGAWDFDKYAVETYRHNVGDHVNEADISNMIWSDMPKTDVWTFGFPCQDLSNAGRQKGMRFKCKSCETEFERLPEDVEWADTCTNCGGVLKSTTRSALFFEVMRLLDETVKEAPEQLPSIIMAENVRGLKKFLPILENEYNKRNYEMYVTMFNSKFWDVSQNRERYFVVGVHKSIKKPFIFPEQQTEFIPKLEDFLDKHVDERFFIDDIKALKIVEKFNFDLDEYSSSPIRYLNRNARNMPQYSLCVDVGKTNGVFIPAYKVKQATIQGYDVAFDGDAINISHPKSKTRRGRVGKQVAQTLLTQSEQVVIVGPRIREFTPREYARLQGFPEDFEIIVSDKEAYKQFGNAVTVNVAKAIAEEIINFLSDVGISERDHLLMEIERLKSELKNMEEAISQ